MPSASQRRILSRNADWIGTPEPNRPASEQYALFRRYLDARHGDGGMVDMTVLDYAMMIEDSHVDTHLVSYRRHGPDTAITGRGLGPPLAFCLTDVLADGLSMVYSFYDPEEAGRSPGTFMILDHIQPGPSARSAVPLSRLLGRGLAQDGLQVPLPAAGAADGAGLDAGGLTLTRPPPPAACPIRIERPVRRMLPASHAVPDRAEAPMIPRYSRPAMTAIWSPESRFRIWFEIEAHATTALAEIGVVPKAAAEAVWAKGRDAVFDVARIDAIEAVTKHDVIAFLTHLAEIVGPEARFVHQGMTSSDVLDTCLNVQLVRAADILIADVDALLGRPEGAGLRAQAHARPSAARTASMPSP